MVGGPSLCETVKLVELRLGVVFRIVTINPVEQELLDLVAGKVRVLFLDTLNGLLEIERLCETLDPAALPASVVACWDFARDIASTRLRDVGPRSCLRDRP